MGDCASRPSRQEIDDHKKERNTTYDGNFISFPSLQGEIESETNDIVLANKRKYYYKSKIEFQRTIQSMTPGYPATPELNIEVQKGIDLEEASSCLNRGHPFVSVKLVPNGPEQQTFVGDPFKPYWHQLIQFKIHNFSFTHVSISLDLQVSIKGTKTLGSVLFDMKDLQDQELREGWYPIQTKFVKNPQIRLRVQFIYNLKMLYDKFIDRCDSLIDSTESRIQSLET